MSWIGPIQDIRALLRGSVTPGLVGFCRYSFNSPDSRLIRICLAFFCFFWLKLLGHKRAQKAQKVTQASRLSNRTNTVLTANHANRDESGAGRRSETLIFHST